MSFPLWFSFILVLDFLILKYVVGILESVVMSKRVKSNHRKEKPRSRFFINIGGK